MSENLICPECQEDLSEFCRQFDCLLATLGRAKFDCPKCKWPIRLQAWWIGTDFEWEAREERRADAAEAEYDRMHANLF